MSLGAYSDALTAPARPRRGRSSTPGLLSLLQSARPQGTTALAPAIRRYLAAARRPGPLVILSDLYDETWRDGVLAASGARCDVTVIHVLSPEELDPTLEGELRLVDDETNHSVDVSMDGDVLERYQAALVDWQTSNASWCSARSVVYVSASSAQAPEEFMLGALRTRGVVAPLSGA